MAMSRMMQKQRVEGAPLGSLSRSDTVGECFVRTACGSRWVRHGSPARRHSLRTHPLPRTVL